MKALFASADFGLVGLLFFFTFFVGVAIWAYRPANKQKLEALKQIPFSEESDDNIAR